jgi:hypothetical protein
MVCQQKPLLIETYKEVMDHLYQCREKLDKEKVTGKKLGCACVVRQFSIRELWK